MNRDHRVRRRVRDYMRDLGAYMHTAEPIGVAPLGAEREDGWLPDISTHARIVVEVLE
jgi:hypothetical protein